MSSKHEDPSSMPRTDIKMAGCVLSVCNLSVEEVIGGWSLPSQPSLLDEFHTNEKPYQEIRWTVPKEWDT